MASLLTVSHELYLPWTSWQIFVSWSGSLLSSSSPFPRSVLAPGRKNPLSRVVWLLPPSACRNLPPDSSSGASRSHSWSGAGFEDVEAGFGRERSGAGQDAAPKALDVGCCSVRSKVRFGEGARAEGGAAGRGRTMTIFFTIWFVKAPIPALWPWEVRESGKHLC